MGPKARSHLGLAGNHCQQQTPLSNILEADPEHSTREISFIHQMPENQDQSFLLPSPNTATQYRKKVESKSGEVTIASQLPIAIPASTTPSVSPSTSPWLRASAPLEENSETETETRTMSSHQSQYPHDSSSKKHSSKSKSKPKAKNDDWTGVTEPEERRRIQNRIAQRKFREKQKEHKERTERDDRNQENAGGSYRVPAAEELGPGDEELSGLPWGGINMMHVVARGHESETRRGSARDNHTHDISQYYNTPSGYNTSSSHQQQTASWGSQGSSGGDDRYQDQQYYYDYDYDYDHDYDPNSGDGSSYQV
ncbi:hypothetical protein F4824DRAFT_466057 [Ustulina deusta]|nr:hypothetical protein F4824DRAFT_466057 [Ustulina deusta]